MYFVIKKSVHPSVGHAVIFDWLIIESRYGVLAALFLLLPEAICAGEEENASGV
jgi:hypothetical protein